MKATIDFDDALYRRLKVEAARRGRTVRDLVAEGVKHVLDAPPVPRAVGDDEGISETARVPWFGVLAKYARTVQDHSIDAARKSVARARVVEPRK